MSVISYVRRVVALGLLSAGPVQAEPAGALDPQFDGDGRQTIAFDVAGDAANSLANDDDFPSMAMAPGGRIYVTGILRRSVDDYAIGLARLRHDGSLDPQFGEQGKVVHDIVKGENVALGSASQADGKLLTAGWQRAEGKLVSTAMLCRFLSDGERDSSFGDDETPGCRMFPSEFGGFFRAAYVQNDGRIIALGSRLQIGAVMVRLHSDGTIDESFGTNGVVGLGAPHGFSSFNLLVQMPDGDFLAAGYTRLNDETVHDILLFRFGADGNPDADFGPDGIKVIPLNLGAVPGRRREMATGLHAFDDGSVLVTGLAQTDNSPNNAEKSYRPFALKLLNDGTSDATFGGGLRVYDPCPTAQFDCNIENYGLAVYADGRFVIAGKYQYVNTNAGDFFAMRLLPDGAPDPSFGPNNVGQESTALVDFGLVDASFALDDGEGVALDGERVLLVGTAKVPPEGNNPGLTTDLALARLDHGLDETFVVSTEVIGNGALSPMGPLNVGHSDHVDFSLTTSGTDEQVFSIEGCGGALYGGVYTTGAIVSDCKVTATFKLKPFADGFE